MVQNQELQYGEDGCGRKKTIEHDSCSQQNSFSLAAINTFF